MSFIFLESYKIDLKCKINVSDKSKTSSGHCQGFGQKPRDSVPPLRALFFLLHRKSIVAPDVSITRSGIQMFQRDGFWIFSMVWQGIRM